MSLKIKFLSQILVRVSYLVQIFDMARRYLIKLLLPFSFIISHARNPYYPFKVKTHRLKAFNDVVLSASLPLYIISVTQKAFWHAKSKQKKAKKKNNMSENVFPVLHLQNFAMRKQRRWGYILCLFLSSLAHKFQDRVHMPCVVP